MTESEAGPDEPTATADTEPGAPAQEIVAEKSPAPRRIPWAMVLVTFTASLALYWHGEETDWRSVGFQLAGALVAFGGLFVAFGREPGGWARTPLGPATREWFGRAVHVELATALATALCVTIVAIAMRPFSGALTPGAGRWSQVAPVLPSDSWLSFVQSVIAAPLCEEALVRGLLLVALAQRLPRRWAVLLSAIVFALAHPAFWPQFLSGVAYGWLTLRCGSLWPAILAHALGNFLTQPITMAGFRLGELASRWHSVPAVLQVLTGVVLVLTLVRFALGAAMGRHPSRLWSRVVTVVAIVTLAWSMVGGGSKPPIVPGVEVASYVRSGWMRVAYGKRANSMHVQGEFVPLAIERGDTTECSVLIRVPMAEPGDPLLDAIRVRGVLAGRPAIIGLQRERHLEVRPLGARAFRTMRWLSEGDAESELIGAPGRVVHGPERREGPLRVVEGRVLDHRSALGDQAEAYVWVPVGLTCWQLTAAVADSNRLIAVMEALDERVARARADVEANPDSGRAGSVERSVLLSDLGRLPSFVRWQTSRLPWLLLGVLTCLVLAWVTVRERRSPSTG